MGQSKSRSAFSLVELSIVLVILGLLVGGVLAGQSLIRAAQLRAVTTEYNRYLTAAMSFRDKYFALPGDMSNAQSFWGVADPTPATCVTTAGSGTQTCNGNGDGLIQPSTGSNESYRFWQHLVNAGLIEGQYDGITHGSNNYSSTNANSPTSKVSPALWYANWWGTVGTNAALLEGVYNNIFELGIATTNNHPATGMLKAEEMWNIDTKLDDGKPGTGKVIGRDNLGFTGTNCTTATASSQTTADYYLAGTGTPCAAVLRQLFN